MGRAVEPWLRRGGSDRKAGTTGASVTRLRPGVACTHNKHAAKSLGHVATRCHLSDTCGDRCGKPSINNSTAEACLMGDQFAFFYNTELEALSFYNEGNTCRTGGKGSAIVRHYFSKMLPRSPPPNPLIVHIFLGRHTGTSQLMSSRGWVGGGERGYRIQPPSPPFQD